MSKSIVILSVLFMCFAGFSGEFTGKGYSINKGEKSTYKTAIASYFEAGEEYRVSIRFFPLELTEEHVSELKTRGRAEVEYSEYLRKILFPQGYTEKNSIVSLNFRVPIDKKDNITSKDTTEGYISFRYLDEKVSTLSIGMEIHEVVKFKDFSIPKMEKGGKVKFKMLYKDQEGREVKVLADTIFKGK